MWYCGIRLGAVVSAEDRTTEWANWNSRVHSQHTDNKIVWHMGIWTLGMVRMGWQLDLGITEVFSSFISSSCLGQKFITLLILHPKRLFGILIIFFLPATQSWLDQEIFCLAYLHTD